jgi:hypothetical protein
MIIDEKIIDEKIIDEEIIDKEIIAVFLREPCENFALFAVNS